MVDDEREAQIRALLPLVRRIALRVHRMVRGSDLGDLVGDGSIGLVRAVDAYDSSHGTTLRAYAARLVLGTMLNGLRRMDPVSERVRQTLRNTDRERYRLATLCGRMPTQREMTQRFPDSQRAATIAYRAMPLSLDAPLPVGERLGSSLSGDPAVIAVDDDERRRLRALLDSLPERERRLVLAYYYGRASLRRIGETFNVSSQRASQLHLAAIARLRKRMNVAAHRG